MSPVQSSASWNVIEGALDETISLLARSEPSPRTRAIMVEARRLRSSIASWRAIPPRPATRKEVFDTAMQLLSKAGQEPPASRSSPPWPSTSRPPAPPTTTSSVPPAPRREVTAPGITVCRPRSMEWRAFAVLEGVTLKVMHREAVGGTLHALVRLAPGAEIPRHRHAAVEDIFMMDGNLVLADTLIRAGEYCHAEAGSIHAAAHSPGGCTFLLLGSEQNEFLLD